MKCQLWLSFVKLTVWKMLRSSRAKVLRLGKKYITGRPVGEKPSTKFLPILDCC